MNSSIDSTIDKIFSTLDKTDFALIRLLLHRNYFMNIIDGFANAIKIRAENKDYYFSFKALPFSLEKIYTAHQLINLQKAFNERRISKDLNYYIIKNNENETYNKLVKLDYIDQILIIYFVSKYSYLKLYNSIDKARLYKKEVKNFNYVFIPPNEIFGELKQKNYNENSLLLLYELANNPLFQKKYIELTKLPTPYILKEGLENNRHQ